ncbi:glycosyltransferase family protein [Tritonibacter horizontis]|uniref:UDP-N-acetylglucosamine--pyrophosphoryl-undecaprenol N-acetylglucosamine transferase n=1 Tax=Tritonibacter horizontis TaxID=1768241 RepID=A0A132C1L3_9RHOB|nr:glycosyltransferase [Tritonibacter horizontis]KUP94453.1 UDP-N-acetylglucosamine--pyrophosphoryl-undecaprenol N-acetylglucosamine transferase [Tritonibacter horizontis]
MKVLIAVTHLLGTGHLSRALTLGRAFAAAGHQVTVCSGGFPAPQLATTGVTFAQLPPLRSDGVAFSRLLDETGALATAAYHADRRARLVTCVTALHPDVVITELYPFGRRALRDEFRALLEAADSLPQRPLILSSIRDILAPPSKPQKAEAADAMIARFYDAVLVHSDPKATRLEVSWPVSAALAAKLHYTGYVAPAPAAPHPAGLGRGEILVSAGGGGVGDALYACAVAAAKHMPQHPWRILVGGSDAAARIATLADPTSPARLEPARPEFRAMLPHAAASVSMCGYNTALDLLQSGVPSVLVPFDAGSEVEQSLRAQSLAPLPGFALEPAASLTPERLCAALRQVMQDTQRSLDGFEFDGARASVEIVATLLRRQRA